MNIAFIFLVLIALVLQITPCSGTAKLMIRFDDFQNTGFLKEDGKCCDGESRNGNCTGQCDYGINICLSRNATGDPCEIETFDVGSVDVDTSSFTFPLTFISGFANPLPITLDSWQGSIIVTITIYDADTEREERVDSFNFTYTKQEPISSRSVIRGDFQEYTLTGKRTILPTRLDAAVAVQCDRFFYGEDCSINCVENDDCNGHYTCNPITGAKICNEGWDGDNCSISVSEDHGCFSSQSCANSAECIRYGNGPSDFYCCCAPGFTGDNCEIDVDECASNPCENGGSCTQDEPNTYACSCPIRFKGQKCEVQRTCDDSPCMNGGDCRPVFGSFFCICDPRFAGDVCETLITTTPATTTPSCPANFYGPSCSVYCEARNDCSGHYTCDSQDGNRICNPTWGGANCTERTISDATCPCQNGGQCFQSQCCCPEEFTGSLCEFRVRCTADRCLNGGQCYEEANGFRCECARGFTGENCETELTTPDPAAACPTDYFGPTCSVFCRQQEDCNAGQWNCHPMTGERLCRFGWRGEFCNQRDPRAQHDVICPNSQCRNGGLCTNSTCCCPIGYTGSLCHIEILECASNPCRNSARCEDLIGDYLCVCSQGYTGKNCEIYVGGSITTQEPDPCLSINCQNGGTCVSNSSSETICLCPEGFQGDFCAEATPRPSATPGCPENYYGPNCLTYCKEEDTCEGGHYYCDPDSGRKLCRSGWIGTICNSRVLLQEIDPECPAVGCKNQGQCFNGSCCCHARSRGEYCQEEILACSRNPCGNGGTCKDLTNGYNCSCSPGYSGTDCETFIGFPPGFSSTTASSVSTSTSTLESCDEVKCLNGGFCVHVVLPFSCVCIYPFSGEYCEIDMSITTTTDSGIVTGQTPTSVIRTIYLRGNVSDSSQSALEQIIQAALNRSINFSTCCPLVYILQKTTYMGPRGDIIVGYVYNLTHTGGSALTGMTPEEITNFSNEVDIGLQRTNPFDQNGVLVYRGPTIRLVNLRYTYTVDFVGDIPESTRQSVIADIEAAWRNANPDCRCTFSADIVQTEAYTGDYGTKISRVYYTITRDGRFQDPNTVEPPSRQVFFATVQGGGSGNSIYTGSILIPYNRRHSVLVNSVVDMGSPQGSAIINDIRSAWIRWRDTDPSVPPNLRSAPLQIIPLRAQKYYTQDGVQMTKVEYFVQLGSTSIVGPEAANVSISGPLYCTGDNCNALPVPFVDVKGRLTSTQLQILGNRLNPTDTTGITISSEQFINSDGEPVTRVYYRPPISGTGVQSTAIGQARLNQILTDLNLQQPSLPTDRSFSLYFGGSIGDNNRTAIQQTIINAWAGYLGISPSVLSVTIDSMNDSYVSTTSDGRRTQVTQVMYTVSVQGADSQWTRYEGVEPLVLSRYITLPGLVLVQGEVTSTQGETTATTGSTTEETTTSPAPVTPPGPVSLIQTIYLKGNISDGSQNVVEEILLRAFNSSMNGSDCCLRLYIVGQTNYIDPNGNLITGYRYNISNSTGGPLDTMTPEQTTVFTNLVNNDLQRTEPFLQTGAIIYTGSVQILRPIEFAYTVDFIGDVPDSWRQAVIDAIEAAWEETYPGDYQATIVRMRDFTGDYGIKVTRVYYTTTTGGQIQAPDTVAPPSTDVFTNVVQQDSDVDELYSGSSLLPYNRHHSVLLTRVVDMDGDQGVIVRNAIESGWLNWRNTNSQVPPNLRNAPLRIVLLRPETYYTQDGRQLTNIRYLVLLNNTIVIGPQTANVTLNNVIFCNCEALPVPFVDVKGQLTISQLQALASSLNPSDVDGRTTNTEVYRDSLGGPVTRVYYRPPISGPDVQSTAVTRERLDQILTNLNLEQYSSPMRRVFTAYFGGSIGSGDTVQQSITDAWAAALGVPSSEISTDIITMDDNFFSSTSNTQVTQVTYSVSLQGADSRWTRFVGVNAGTLGRYLNSTDLYIVGGAIIRAQGGTVSPGQTTQTTTTVTVRPTTTTTTQTIYLTGVIREGSQPSVEEILQSALNNSNTGSSCCLRLYIIETTSYLDPSGNVITGYTYNVTNSTSGTPVTMTPEQTNNFTIEVSKEFEKSDPLRDMPGGVAIYTGSVQGLRNTGLTYTVDFIGDLPQSRRRAILNVIEEAWQQANPGCACQFAATMVQTQEYTGDYGKTVSRVFYTIARDGVIQEPSSVQPPSQAVLLNTVQGDTNVNSLYIGGALLPSNRRHTVLLNRVVDIDGNDGRVLEGIITTAWMNWIDLALGNLRDAPLRVVLLRPQMYYTQDGTQLSMVPYYVVVNNTIILGPQTANLTITGSLVCDDCDALPVPYVDVKGQLTFIELETFASYLNPFDRNGSAINTETFLNTVGEEVTRVYYRPPITSPEVTSTAIDPQRLTQVLEFLNIEQPSRPIRRTFNMYFGGSIDNNDISTIEERIINAWASTLGIPADAVSVKVETMDDNYYSMTSNTQVTRVTYRVSIQGADSHWTRFVGLNAGTLTPYFTSPDLYIVGGSIIRTPGGTLPTGQTPSTGPASGGTTDPTVTAGPTAGTTQTIYLTGNISDGTQPAVVEILQNALNKSSNGASCCLRLYVIERTSYIDPSGVVVTGYRYNVTNSTSGMPVTLTPDQTSDFTREVNNEIQKSDPLLIGGVYVYTDSIQGLKTTELAYTVDLIGRIPESRQKSVLDAIEQAWQDAYPNCRCVFRANIVQTEELSGDYGITVSRVYYTVTRDGQPQDPDNVAAPSRQDVVNVIQQDSDVNQVYPGSQLIPYNQRHGLMLNRVVDMDGTDGSYVRNAIQTAWIDWKNTDPSVPDSLRNADVSILMLKPLKYYTQDGREINKIEYFVLLNNTVIGPQRANVTLTDPLFCDCQAVPVPFVDIEGELTPVQTQILGLNLNPLDTSGVTIERENFVDTNGGSVTRVYYRPPISGPGVQSTEVSQQRLNQILTNLNLQQPADPLEKSFILYMGGRITDNDRDNIQRTIRNAWSNTYNLPVDAISVNVISLNDSFTSTPGNTPATQVRYTVTITDADSHWTRFDGVDPGTLGRYFTPTGYTVIQGDVVNTQVTTAPGGTTASTGVSVTPTTPTGTTNFVSVIYLRGNISDSNQAAVQELLQNALNKTKSGSCCIELYIIEKTTYLDSSGDVITGYRFNASNGTAPVVLTPGETSNFTNEVNNGLQTSTLFQGIVIYQGAVQGPSDTYSVDFIGDIPETRRQAVITDIERTWTDANPDCRCVFRANIVNMDEFSGDFGIKVTRVYYTMTKDGLVQDPQTVTPPSRQIFYNTVQADDNINSIYSGATLIPYSQHHNVLLSKVVDMNSDEGRQVLDQIRSTWITWRDTSPAVPENLRQTPVEIKLLRPLIYYTQDGRQLTRLEYFVILNSTNVIGPQQPTSDVTFTGPLFCDDCDAIPVPFVEVKGRLSPAQIQTLSFTLNPSDGSAVNTETFFNSENEPVTRVYYRPPISGPDVTSTAVSQQILNQVLANQNLEQPSLPTEKSFTVNIAGGNGNNNRNAIIQILKNLWVTTFNIPSDSVSIDVKNIDDSYVSSTSGSPAVQVTYTVDIQGADSRWTQFEGVDPATLDQYFRSLGITLIDGDVIRIEGRTTPSSGTGQTAFPTSPTGTISTVSVIVVRGNISDNYQPAVEELLLNALNRTKNGPSCCIQLYIIEQSTVFDPNGDVLTSYRFNATNSGAPVLLTPDEIANFTNEVSNGLQTSEVLRGQGLVIYQGPVQGPTDTYSVDYVGDIPETRKGIVVRDIERAWLNAYPDCRCAFKAEVVRGDEFSGDFGIKITRVYYRIRRDGLVQDPQTVTPPSRQIFYNTVQSDDSNNSIYTGTTLIPYSQHHNVLLSKVVDMSSDEGRQVLDQIRSTWITWRDTSPTVPENLRQTPVEIRQLRPLIYYTQDGRQLTKLEYFVILNGTIVIAPQAGTDSVIFTGPLFCDDCDAIPVPFMEVQGRLSPGQLSALASDLNPSGGSVTMSEMFVSFNNEPVTRVYYTPPISGPDVTSTAVSQETLNQILTNQNLELPTLPIDKSFTLNIAGRIGDNDRNAIQRTIQSVWGTTFNIPSNSLRVDIKSMDDSYVSSTSNTPVTQVIYTVAIQGADSRWTQYEGVDPGVLDQYFRSNGLTLVQGSVERTTQTTSGTGSAVTTPTPTGTTNLDGVIYLTGNISNNEQAALEEIFKSALNKTKNGPACCINLYIIERTNYLDSAGNSIIGYRYNATNGSTPMVLTPTERDNFTREVNNDLQTLAPFRGRGIQVYQGSVQAPTNTYTVDFIGQITQAEGGAVITDIEKAWLSVNPDCECLFKANITKTEALSGDFGTVVTRVYYTITRDGLVQDPQTVTPPSRQIFYNTVQSDDSINSIYSGTSLIPYSQHHNVLLSKVVDMNSDEGRQVLDQIRFTWITWRNADQAVPESLRGAPLEIRLLRPQLYYTTNGTQLTKLEYFVILNNTTVIGPQPDTERVSLKGPLFCDCKAIPVPFIEVKGLLSSAQLQALGSSLNTADGLATKSELFITSENDPVTRVYYLPQISGPDVTSTAVSRQRLNQILTNQNLEEPSLPTDKTFALNFEGRVGSDKIPQIEQIIKNLWIGSFDIPSDAVSVNVENLDDDYVSSSNNPITRMTYTVSIRGADSKWTRFEGVDPAQYFTSPDLVVFGGEINRRGTGTSSSTTSTTSGPMSRTDNIYLKGTINDLDQPEVEAALQRAMDRINSGSSCCLKVDIVKRTTYANPAKETVVGYRYTMTNTTGGTVSELTPEQRNLLTNELNRELPRVPQFRWNGVTVYSGSLGDLRNLGITYGIDITGTVPGTQSVVDVIEQSWGNSNPECGCQFKADIFLTKQLSGDYGMVVTRAYYTITRDGQAQNAETVPPPSREVISAAVDNDKGLNPLYYGSAPVPYDQHHSVVLNRVVDMSSEEGQGVVRTLQTEWKKWQNTDSTVPGALRAQPLEILLLRPQLYYTQANTTVTSVEYLVKLGDRYLIGPDISISLSGGMFCDCEAIPVPFLDVQGELQWSKLLELGTSLKPADTTGTTVERQMFSDGDGEPVTRVFYKPTIENGNVQSTALAPERLDEILTNHNLERPSLPVKKVFTFNFDGGLDVDQKSAVADGLQTAWSSSLGIPAENVSVVVNDMNDNFYSTTSDDQVTQVKYTVAIQRGDSHWTRFEGVDAGTLGEKFSSTTGVTYCGCSAREGREIMVTGVVGNDTTDLETALTKAWMQANPEYTGTLSVGIKQVEGDAPTKLRYIVTPTGGPSAFTENDLTTPQDDLIGNEISPLDLTVYKAENSDDSDTSDWAIPLGVVLGLLLLLIIIIVIVLVIRNRRHRMSHTLKQKPEELNGYDKQHFSDEPHFNNPAFNMEDPEIADGKQRTYIVNEEQTMEDIKLDRST